MFFGSLADAILPSSVNGLLPIEVKPVKVVVDSDELTNLEAPTNSLGVLILALALASCSTATYVILFGSFFEAILS